MPKTIAAKAAKETVSEAAPEETGTELVERSTGTNLATAMEDFSGDGLENVTADDLLVPRIAIIQATSDQIKPKKAVYVKGAVVGDICNLGTGEIYEAPLSFLPVHYAKQWLEWKGGVGEGLAAIHNDASILDECDRDDDGKYLTKKDGHQVQESAQFFGLNLSAGGSRCFIGLKSTELKKSKKWLTLATSEKLKKKGPDGVEVEYTPALFYRTYDLSVVDESNTKGDWTGFKIERGKKLEELDGWQAILEEVKKFRASIKRGEVRADEGTLGSEEAPRSERAM